MRAGCRSCLACSLTGSSIDDAREGRWLLGPFESVRLWQPWTLRALTGADWSAVLGQWAGIVTAVFVATIAILFNISGTEVVLDRDLDTNQELRDAGVLNVLSGALGGIPGYHALSLTALAERMSVNARTAGLVAALVPLAAVVFGAAVVELIPRMIVGGVLVFLGLAFIVEWVWDKRRLLPRLEYVVVLVILVAIIAERVPARRRARPGARGRAVRGQLRPDRAGARGRVRGHLPQQRRPPARGAGIPARDGRPGPDPARARVRVLRLGERPARADPQTGGGGGAAVPGDRPAAGDRRGRLGGYVLRQGDAPGPGQRVRAGVRRRLRDRCARSWPRGRRGGLEGVVAFEPDLDRGLQRCEDALLRAPASDSRNGRRRAGGRRLLPGLSTYLERVPLAEGTVLIRQDEPPDDVFVLESGRLSVETVTPEGTRMRLRAVRPGVVVGEVALYTGVPRTADVVAETPSVVLRLSRASIERMEADEPELAAALHRWLATTLAERLTDTSEAFDALLD